jgi:Zn-finger nucleic acid-binding protein
VWLDRGELDKLIERSATIAPAPASSAAARSQPQFVDSDYDHRRGPQGGRKKSWLSNIFD